MSADPAIYDGLTIWRGLTFTRVFTCTAGGSPVDLSGWTGEFKAKATIDSENTVFDLTSSPGLVMGGQAGTITVTISDEDTADIEDDELHYTLKITNGTEVAGLLVGVIPVPTRACHDRPDHR